MGFEMETNPKYQEILRLADLLEKAEIPYAIRKSYAGWCIKYRGGKHCTGIALQHDKTLGHEYDLIEVRGFGLERDERDGFLKVWEAFEYFDAAARGLKHPPKGKRNGRSDDLMENVITDKT